MKRMRGELLTQYEEYKNIIKEKKWAEESWTISKIEVYAKSEVKTLRISDLLKRIKWGLQETKGRSREGTLEKK